MMTSLNTDFIPFASPLLGEEEEQAVLEVLRSGWLTTGKVCTLFESEFAEFTGARHALAVNSGTAGLHLSIDALGLPPGSLVATTPYTFAASSEIIRYVGCDPLFIDIEEDTYNIDPNLLEKSAQSEKGYIAAMIPVHIAGLPCNMAALLDISKRYEIPIIEDAAHAFPVVTDSGYVGTFGETGVYSFYANKTITTGEGGMIVTNRDDLAQKIRINRLHGIDRACWDRYLSPSANWKYEIVSAGFKYNMPDLAAAIGRVQLKKADLFLKQRRRIASCYIKNLSGLDFLKIPVYSEEHAWHIFIIRLKPEKLNITRDDFINRLRAEGIGTSVHFIPLHMMPYYRKKYGYREESFPVALRNYVNSLSLPIYHSMRQEQVNRVIETVKKIGYSAYRTSFPKS